MDDQRYIDQYLNPILEPMVIDILLHKPTDLVEFMVKWLTDKKPAYFSQEEHSEKEKSSDVCNLNRVKTITLTTCHHQR